MWSIEEKRRLQPANRPWPVQLSAYDYTRLLSRSRWSWEFMRRNAEYIGAWQRNRCHVATRHDRVLGARVLHLERDDRGAEAWGMPFFHGPPEIGRAHV